MKKLLVRLSLLTVVALTATEAMASSVGSGIYIPVTATRSSSQCPTGVCRSGATCSHCARLGFACVDGATAPPCSADGACHPNRQTHGFYTTRWRRWPGEVDPSAPSPTVAEEGDSLLKVYEPPTPEEEDKHAPPPIEESIDEINGEGTNPVPPLEIELPPFPRITPGQQPAVAPPVPARETPPSLPFGLVDPASTNEQPLEFTMGQPVALPNSNSVAPAVKSEPTHRPIVKNRPPALPVSFTNTSQQSIRRLPTAPSHRIDTAIRPASVYVPVTVGGPNGATALIPAVR